MTIGRKIAIASGVMAAGILILGGCEDRKSAHSSQTQAAAPPSSPADRASTQAPATFNNAPRLRRPATPEFNGRPMWAENRRGTSEENARYQFEHRGGDLDAKSMDEYLTRVHNFFEKPPKDLETVTRTSNGDLLVYSPSQNLFGVIRKDGAPRLLMKSPSGRAYWEEQRNQAGGSRAGESALR